MMASLDFYNVEDKIDLLKNMVLYMYLISDENCQKKIKEYIDREDYFSIFSLNKGISDFVLENLIICVLVYHTEGLKDLSDKDRDFIIQYLEKHSDENKPNFILSYYNGLRTIKEEQKTNKIKEVVALFEDSLSHKLGKEGC